MFPSDLGRRGFYANSPPACVTATAAFVIYKNGTDTWRCVKYIFFKYDIWRRHIAV